MCEKILLVGILLVRNFSLHIYTTTSDRVGFLMLSIFFLGETPLNGNTNVINFIILCCKQYCFSCLLQSIIQDIMCDLFMPFENKILH